MPFHQHIGLRVGDIDRSVKFYEQAFGARRRTPTFRVDGDFAKMVTNGPVGIAFDVCLLTFDDGTSIELFDYVKPAFPTDLVPPFKANLTHLGVEVDDVDATFQKVLEAGGKRFWDEPIDMADWRVVYVVDPDNNAIEITDASIDDMVKLVEESFL